MPIHFTSVEKAVRILKEIAIDKSECLPFKIPHETLDEILIVKIASKPDVIFNREIKNNFFDYSKKIVNMKRRKGDSLQSPNEQQIDSFLNERRNLTDSEARTIAAFALKSIWWNFASMPLQEI